MGLAPRFRPLSGISGIQSREAKLLAHSRPSFRPLSGISGIQRSALAGSGPGPRPSFRPLSGISGIQSQAFGAREAPDRAVSVPCRGLVVFRATVPTLVKEIGDVFPSPVGD